MPATIESTSSGAPRPSTSDRGATALVCLALALLTLMVYAQVGGFDFVNLDDGIFVKDLREVTTGLTRENIVWAFGIHGPGQWHPLAYLSHQAAFEWFGSEPRAHHLINVAFHVASAVLLLLALRRLTGRLWPSAAVATLFALHPLHVASVAWISERRDVLCAFFWMLSLWAYAGYARRGGVSRYLAVAAALALALMSKPMAVTLPCVLLLLDFWPLRRGRIAALANDSSVGVALDPCPQRSWKFLIVEKIPLLLMSAGASVLTILCHAGAIATFVELPLHVRILNAVAAYAIYLRKLVWPSDLACWYPHPALQSGFSLSALAIQAAVGFVVLLSITALVLWQARRRPYLLVGWCWYLGVLVPVSGLFQTGTQAYLDHFTYLPLIGIYIAIAWVGAEVISQHRWARTAAAIAVPMALVALLVVTSKQIGTWRNSRTLHEHALRVTGDNALAECNLVNYFLSNPQAGDESLQVARKHIKNALRLAPDSAPVQSNAGALYLRLGDRKRAAEHFIQAIELNAMDPVANFNLGTLLTERGDAAGAIRQFRTALQYNPHYFDAMTNLAVVYLSQQQVSEAVDILEQAVALQPNNATPYNTLGVIAKNQGNLRQAEEYFRRAVALDPSSASAHYNLADVLLRTQRVDEAIAAFFQAILHRNEFPDAYCSLGTAFLMKRDLQSATKYLNRALQLNPELGEAHNNLGAALEDQGKLAEAREHYRHAVRIDPRNSGAQDNLRRVTAELEKMKQPLRPEERSPASSP